MTLSADGQMFDQNITNPPATIQSPVSSNSFGQDTVNSRFCWDTDCGQYQNLPYIFSVSVTDQGCPPKTTNNVYEITVTPTNPPANIYGDDIFCQNSTAIYSTDPNSTISYNWSVDSKGTIIQNYGDSVEVLWNTPGTGSISLSAVNAHGCISNSISENATITPSPTVEAGDDITGEGGVAAQSLKYGSGSDLGIVVSGSGLTIGAYAMEVENDRGESARERNPMTATWYANYTFGPVSVGYQTGGLDYGNVGAGEAATAAKTLATAKGDFEFEKMSIAFNVNENLSLSWGELEETYDAQSNVKGGTEIADVEMSSTSIQFAYTMGSMSFKGYQTDTDNPGFDSNAKSDEVTELAVNFAF